MDIQFQYHDVKASPRLENLAEKKIDKLLDKYDFIIRADVFFKSEHDSDHTKGKICNIRLSIPGPLLFAEASHDSFEASIAEAVDDLGRQLARRKEKMRSHKK